MQKVIRLYNPSLLLLKKLSVKKHEGIAGANKKQIIYIKLIVYITHAKNTVLSRELEHAKCISHKESDE